MQQLLQLPPGVHAAVLFIVGCAVGGQLNRAIYRLAYFPRWIGPWSRPEAGAPPRKWFDRIPVFGWLGLARESAIHGRGYWIRPLLIELGTGVLFALWYLHTMTLANAPVPPLAARLTPEILQAQFLGQIVLLSLMIVATFIDFDEQTIPDEITLFGTLFGLALSAILPTSMPRRGFLSELLLLTAPNEWEPWLDGGSGLAISVLLLNLWILAVLPKTWYPNRGLKKALDYLVESIRREPINRWFAGLAVIGSLAIGGVWMGGGPRWQALLTSLVGMAGGASMIWSIRIAGSSALAKEAMGFGDVTLMGMIGAFIGWQMSMLVFFLAPLAGLVIGLTQWLISRRHDIAYGPYLCLATVVMLWNWSWFWTNRAAPTFQLGLTIPMLFAICVFLIWVLLSVWNGIKTRIGLND